MPGARSRRSTSALAALIALALSSAAHGGEPELRPFRASYSWSWSGITVAVSNTQLRRDQGDEWVYSSSSEPRGLGRLYPLRPKLQSVMLIKGESVQPLTFLATDSGSRHDADVQFDWEKGRATGKYEGVDIDLPIKPGVQDDASVTIALIDALLHGEMPHNIALIDKSGIREYEYRRSGEATLATALGPIDTIIYTSHHPDSPRTTYFWCAPSKSYLPMRVEQRLKQKQGAESLEWAMQIRSVSLDE
jgi:hypothetical protein